MIIKPYRLFPDLAEAGLYGGLLACFAVNMADPLYGHAVKLLTALSWGAISGLLALPAQIFVAAFSAILMVLGGLITALPALLLGVRAARYLHDKADHRPFMWLGAGVLLGLANMLLLMVITGIGNDGTADALRACALYGGGGAGAGYFLPRRQRERGFYNS